MIRKHLVHSLGVGTKSIGTTHKDILNYITHQFRSINATDGQLRMIVLIFGRPSAKIVEEEIIPNLDYWHLRTGDHLDMFCVGFAANSEYDTHVFDEAVKHFEKATDWQYSGGTDLVLLNARYAASVGYARFDLSSAVTLTLEDATASKAIMDIPIFIERIIHQAKLGGGQDPLWGVSDREGLAALRKALVKVLLAVLPAGVGEEIQKAYLFTIRDISKKRRIKNR